jgi:hypothetical protein
MAISVSAVTLTVIDYHRLHESRVRTDNAGNIRPKGACVKSRPSFRIPVTVTLTAVAAEAQLASQSFRRRSYDRRRKLVFVHYSTTTLTARTITDGEETGTLTSRLSDDGKVMTNDGTGGFAGTVIFAKQP